MDQPPPYLPQTVMLLLQSPLSHLAILSHIQAVIALTNDKSLGQFDRSQRQLKRKTIWNRLRKASSEVILTIHQTSFHGISIAEHIRTSTQLNAVTNLTNVQKATCDQKSSHNKGSVLLLQQSLKILSTQRNTIIKPWKILCPNRNSNFMDIIHHSFQLKIRRQKHESPKHTLPSVHSAMTFHTYKCFRIVENIQILYIIQQYVTEHYTITIFTTMHHWSTTNFKAPEDCFLMGHDGCRTVVSTNVSEEFFHLFHTVTL